MQVHSLPQDHLNTVQWDYFVWKAHKCKFIVESCFHDCKELLMFWMIIHVSNFITLLLKYRTAAAPVSCSAYGAHQGQSPLLTQRIIFNALTFLNLTIISAKWHVSTLPSWGNTCVMQSWTVLHLVQNPILFHLASRKSYQPQWTETGQKVNCVLYLGKSRCLVKMFILQTFLYIFGGKKAI